MQSHTSQRARSSRSQGTRRRASSAASPSLVPPASQHSITSETYGSQVSTAFQSSQDEGSDILQHESGIPTQENDAQNVEPSPSSQSREKIPQERFPNQLFKMIQDPLMADYIRWDGTDSDVFHIPNTDTFVTHALSVYFQRVHHWDSFRKQLENYQFEKQVWDLGGCKYAHQNKKFRKDRKDLLREVVPKPKTQTTLAPHVVAQAPPPPLPCASSSPATVPLLPSQADFDARLSQLENTISELNGGLARQAFRESRLLAKEKRLLTREKRLFARETRVAAREKRVAVTEKRLVGKEKRLVEKEKRLSTWESRLLEEKFQPPRLSGGEPAVLVEDGSAHPANPTESAGVVFDEDSEMNDLDTFLDANDGIAPPPQIDTIGGGNVQEGSSSHLVTRAALDTVKSAPSIEVPTPPQPSGFPSPTGTRPSSPSINGYPTIQELLGGNSASDDTAGWWHHQFHPYLGTWTWWQDHPPSAQTNQASTSTQTPSSHGSRAPVVHVPEKLAPGSGRSR